MEYSVRALDPHGDYEQFMRLIYDAGWNEEDFESEQLVRLQLGVSYGFVAVDDAGICGAVLVTDGVLKHQHTDVKMCALLAVVTALRARRMGIAKRLIALSCVVARQRGCVVATLGAFDQGYYNDCGFGNGLIEPIIYFDPSTVGEMVRGRTVEPSSVVSLHGDVERMHAARCRRLRGHGGIVLDASGFTAGEVAKCGEESVALGITKDGMLRSHFFAHRDKQNKETHLKVLWTAVTEPQDMLDILKVFYNFSDQIEQIKMTVPPFINMQDVLERPFRSGFSLGAKNFEEPFWQIKILDVAAAFAVLSVPTDEPMKVRCQVVDPLVAVGDGVGSESATYDMVLDRKTKCVARGAESAQSTAISSSTHAATVTTDICTLSRLWVGAATAQQVRTIGALQADDAFVKWWDQSVRLPAPVLDWEC